MKESLWGYLILLLGVIVTTVMLLVSRVTTHAEEDYYLAREIMQSAMLDAVDYGAYRTTGKIIMSKSKFMEVYIRRFAESVTNSQDYQIDFYDIYEEPPKASVRIRTSSSDATINSDRLNFSIDTLISGILETNFEQYNAIDVTKENNATSKEYSEGESSTVRYTTTSEGNYMKTNVYELVSGQTVKKTNRKIPSGSRVTLAMSEVIDQSMGLKELELAESNDLTNRACAYKIQGGQLGQYCKVFYNGEEIYIYRKNLSRVNTSIYEPKNDSFIKNNYKLCEYSSLKSNSGSTSIVEYKWIKNSGTIAYPSVSSSKNGKTVEACTLVKVTGCNYGSNKNMCKVENKGYIYESDLKDEYECGKEKVSIPDNVTLKDLQNIGTIDEIAKDVSQKKYMLIVLDQNGVTDLGTPIYYYYDTKTEKMYKSYNRSSKKFSDEVKKITIPKVNKKSCQGYIVKNGGFVIDSKGNMVSDFEKILKSTYGSDAIVYILYPMC